MTVTFIETDGGKLAVDIAGEGPLVICSPGMGDFRDAYDALATELRKSGYRVAMVDLRGHGDSSTTFNRYGDEATADDLITLIDAYGGGPAVLAGASLSGAAATIAGGSHPEKVAGLILFGAFLRPGTGKLVASLFRLSMRQPIGPMIWKSYAPKLWPGLGDKVQERVDRSIAMLTGPGRWKAFHATLSTDHAVVAPYISKVKAPVLAVYGDADPDWTDPIEEARWVASNFEDSEVVAVKGVGHAPMMERPEEVTPAVLKFLDRIRASGGFNRA
ncbi:AB hydrolase superfamily yisY [Fusarium subglutinans]|uniref:AB hydrolase superfamily yisY n=1 Tax=Gibberella subglutinans TaxID=42677 RepID=A0A8H5P6V0_GIBSU|nr:AB hydrolase superfamily yisY [Fusarium subglutinans]KAF5591147.1 AB hydrolase superfamily yisY [Fusarium subglutinans]